MALTTRQGVARDGFFWFPEPYPTAPSTTSSDSLPYPPIHIQPVVPLSALGQQPQQHSHKHRHSHSHHSHSPPQPVPQPQIQPPVQQVIQTMVQPSTPKHAKAAARPIVTRSMTGNGRPAPNARPAAAIRKKSHHRGGTTRFSKRDMTTEALNECGLRYEEEKDELIVLQTLSQREIEGLIELAKVMRRNAEKAKEKHVSFNSESSVIFYDEPRAKHPVAVSFRTKKGLYRKSTKKEKS